MRIALDATYSAGERLSGVGVYSREILNGLAGSGRAEWLWCYRAHRFAKALARPHPHQVRLRPFIESWVPRADLFHGLNQRLPRTRLRRTVVTFHDLFVMTAEYSTGEFRRRFTGQAREAARRADRVIAVSRFTAAQVRDLLGVEAARIDVVHHGMRSFQAPPGAAREKIILSTGAMQTRKNTRRLVEAFEQLGPEWRLVLAGPAGFGGEEILRRIESSPRRASIAVLGWINDQELAGLYARAGAFAFPSLDEGFGMPVLEAMSAGIPVLTSNRSAMPEVAGDAAVLVNPEDLDQIVSGLKRLTSDEELRADLVRRGYQRAREFTWEKAVEQTWEVYQKAMHS